MRVTLFCCQSPRSISEPSPLPGLRLRLVCADRDAQAVARFGDDLASSADAWAAHQFPGPRPPGCGLLAELVSRPGRNVESWLAIQPTTSGEGAVGLISLVTSCLATGIRHSIGWLLVHPAARRRGVGRALVACACHRAADRDGKSVWVECRSDWTVAMAFWQAVGFTAAGAP